MNPTSEEKSFIKRTITIGFTIIALGILFFFAVFRSDVIAKGISSLVSILRPFVIGAIIAYLLLPFTKKTEDFLDRYLPQKLKHFSKTSAVIISLLFTLLLIYLLLILVLPDLVESIEKVAKNLPKYYNSVIAYAENKFANDEVLLGYIEQIYDNANKFITEWVNNKLLPGMQSLLSNVGAGVFSIVSIVKDLVIGIIVSVYLLMGRRRFASQAKLILYGIFRPSWADAILQEVKYADKVFTGFLIGKIIDSAIIGVICYIFCIIARMPNALLCSVIIGVTNIIPFFGPFIGMVPTTFLILMTSPLKALVFIIFIIILQQVDGNIIGPKILGNSTGLSSFWVLFAILFFGGLFGFTGMIIGIPLFAVIYDIVRKILYTRLKHFGKYEMITSYDENFHQKIPEKLPKPAAEESHEKN